MRDTDDIQTQFRGFRSPNYTQVPDELFDELLPELSGAELKVLLYIIRRTLGFKRESDSISLSQMLHGLRTRSGRALDRGTGLSKPTLLQALRSLEAKHIILAERRSSSERGDEPTIYQLRFIDQAASAATVPVVKNLDQGEVKNAAPPVVKKLASQETVLRQTELKDSNLRKAHDQESTDSATNGRRRSTGQGGQAAGLEAVGAIISRRGGHVTRTTAYDEDRQILVDYLTDFSREFGDQAPKSSVTRVYRLFKNSGLPREAFLSRLYEARAITKEQTGSIRGRKFPYFLSVLEDLLGLKQDESLPPPAN